MNITQAADILRTHMQTNWSTTPVAWKNYPAKDYNAAQQPMLETGTDDWVSVELSGPFSRPVEIPLTCSRYTMFMTVEIYIREDTGTRNIHEHIDELATLFEFKTLSGVRMKEVTSVGSYKLLNGWATEVVQIPFEFDRTL